MDGPGRQDMAGRCGYIRVVAYVPGDQFSELPDPVRQLLAQPPVTEKKLLELRAEWPALSPGRARMADALRLFVITWDPLELLAPRPAAFAAVNTDPLELAVYLPCWSLAELAAKQGKTMAAALGAVSPGSASRCRARKSSACSGRCASRLPWRRCVTHGRSLSLTRSGTATTCCGRCLSALPPPAAQSPDLELIVYGQADEPAPAGPG